MKPLCNGFYLFPLSRTVNSNSLIFDPSEFKIGLYFGVFFLGKLANVLLRNFYYNALRAFFDALIQRTDGCTEFLWLLVQPHHSIHCSYKRYINRYLSQHMIFQYQDEDSGEPVQMYRLARAFSA